MLAVTAGVGQASWSRVEGMGLTSPYLWQFTDDYANIYYYPTSVVRQNNLVLAELGSNVDGNTNEVDSEVDQSLTVIKNFPRFGSIAYQMKQNALNSSFPNSLTHEQIDLIWGTALSKMDIAVRFDMTNSKFEHSENIGGVAANWEAAGSGAVPADPYPFGALFLPGLIQVMELNTFGVTPAIAFHMQNDNRVEAAVTFRQYSLDRNRTDAGVAGESWKDDGGLSYAVKLRGILGGGDGTWYPAFWWVNDDLSWEVTGIPGLTARSADEKYTNIGAGISRNMRVNDNNLLIFGVAAWQQKIDYERTDNNDAVLDGSISDAELKNTMAPLFFASLETEATSWLKVRLGGTHSMVQTRTELSAFNSDTATDKEKTSDFTFNIGAGLKWNNLDIDVTVNEAFPLSGGWVLSGDEETPFTRASATYHF
jgi:hypothetical protein